MVLSVRYLLVGRVIDNELEGVSSVSTVRQIRSAAKAQLPNTFNGYGAGEIQVYGAECQWSGDRTHVIKAGGHIALLAGINAAASTLQLQPPHEPGSLLLFVPGKLFRHRLALAVSALSQNTNILLPSTCSCCLARLSLCASVAGVAQAAPLLGLYSTSALLLSCCCHSHCLLLY